MKAAALSLAAVLLAAGAASACSVCGCGDPLLVASDPAAINGKLRIDLDSEILSATAGAADHLTQISARFNAAWSPTQDLGLYLQLPFTRKHLETGTTTEVTGLGDVELGGRYRFAEWTNFGAHRRQSLAVSGGVSLPTGPNDASLLGERVEEHAQAGTGSFGPYAGLHYLLELDDWMAFASATFRYHTDNGHQYRYGQSGLWSAHVQYRGLAKLAFEIGLDGRMAAADRDAGVTVSDTGGFALAAAPGAFWNVKGPLWLSLRAQLPFYTQLQGVQTLGPTIVAGLQVMVL